MGSNPRSNLQDGRTPPSSPPSSISHQTLTHDQIRFLGDPSGDFTSKLDLAFDATSIFGQPRSKRYALLIEDGKVKEAHIEPDNTGVNGTCPSFVYLTLPK